jgi:hypothetical protein
MNSGGNIVAVDPKAPDPLAISQAADLLRRGDLVAFPTETVYGLGANALEEAAVRRSSKRRGDPLTILSSCTSPASRRREHSRHDGRSQPNDSRGRSGRGRSPWFFPRQPTFLIWLPRAFLQSGSECPIIR